jgi:hypothetical protein
MCSASAMLNDSAPRLQPEVYPAISEEPVSDFDNVHPDSSLVMAEQSAHDVVNQTMSVGDHSPSDANEDKSIRHSTGRDVTTVDSRIDTHEGETPDQGGQRFENGETSYPLVNGQAHVCQTAFCLSLSHPNSIHEQTESEGVQTSSGDHFTQMENNPQDSDFDGSLSRNQSVGDLSISSDTDTRKAEGLSVPEDTKNQDANNAARRPASFKPVSFAKYSAAKVAGINSAAKSTTDKGEPPGLKYHLETKSL